MNVIDAAMLITGHRHRMNPHYRRMIFLGFLLLLLLPEYESISATKYSLLPENLKTENRSDKHGGIKMGIVSHECDNAKLYLNVDLKDSTVNYMCPHAINHSNAQFIYKVKEDQDADPPIHICLPENISYDEDIPASGSHRPLWPIYGDYLYLPPQRWLHSLEHGAAVFLYHPCAEEDQVQYFKDIAFNCLKKIIVTPSSKVPKETPFVIVTYKKKILMNKVDKDVITKYLQSYDWSIAPEHKVWSDGFYKLNLQRSSYNNSVFENNYKNVCSKDDSNVNSYR